MAQNTAEKLVSFDAEKASRYLERSFGLFLGDPPDSDYQRGYLAALLTLYRDNWFLYPEEFQREDPARVTLAGCGLMIASAIAMGLLIWGAGRAVLG